MAGDARSWTFLTNHAHVLVCLASDPEARVRDVAARVGITPRAAQSILNDLEAAGYLHRERVGRRNRYTIASTPHLRHPVEVHVRVGDLLRVLTDR